jgi:hypothetical protein
MLTQDQKDKIAAYWRDQQRERTPAWYKLRDIVIYTDKATDHRIQEVIFELLEAPYESR